VYRVPELKVIDCLIDYDCVRALLSYLFSENWPTSLFIIRIMQHFVTITEYF